LRKPKPPKRHIGPGGRARPHMPMKPVIAADEMLAIFPSVLLPCRMDEAYSDLQLET